MWPRQIAESLFAVLFPADCRICSAPLVKISRLPVCGECLSAMRPIAGGVCAVCGERLFSPYALSGPDEPRCGLCRRLAPPFARASAYGSYESGLRELIHLLKYGEVRPAANVLGRMLAEAVRDLEPDFGAGPIVVVPVPLHRGKLRQRGFNQAELIVRAAMKFSPLRDRMRLGPVLDRTRATASQTGLTGHQRRENLRGAFKVTRPDDIKDRQALVVDDVYTTGATVSECARVLRRAGATRVWVATVARTLKASAQHAEIGPYASDGQMDEEIGAHDVPMARAAGG